MEETKQENQETAEEPAQSPPAERVTEKDRDPNKSSSRACRRCRPKGKARRTTSRAASSSQENSSQPPGTPANIPPKKADQAVSRPKRREGLTNWTPWIVGACLAGGAFVFLRQTRSAAAGPADSTPKRRVDKPPRPDRQLKTDPYPFYMEWATMTTPATDGKKIVNALYHSAVVSGLAMGYTWLGKITTGGSTAKLDPTPRDVGMVVLDVALAMGTRCLLIKQRIIPADIMK